MAVRLRVQEISRDKGISMAELARKADLGTTTMQRMWHNSASGRIGDSPLESVHLPSLERIADVLGIEIGELLERVPDK